MFDSTEQKICDQARVIRKNGWLTNVELEVIKRRVLEEENSESQYMGETRDNVDRRQEMKVVANERHKAESRINENGVVIEGEMNEEEKEMIKGEIKRLRKDVNIHEMYMKNELNNTKRKTTD